MQRELTTLPPAERTVFESEVARLATLEQVVRWAFALTPPSDVAEVVVQDEFSHEVVVPWRGRWLVFDTT